jgi:hypothetical protein
MRKEQEEHENQHRQFLIGLLDCTIKCALISLGFDLSFEVSYPYIICHSSNKMVMICILFVKYYDVWYDGLCVAVQSIERTE